MAGVDEKARLKSCCCCTTGGMRRAVQRCLAMAEVAVVRLGVCCCFVWKPLLARDAEGRMVLAVQERRGSASRVRSADGAAMICPSISCSKQ